MTHNYVTYIIYVKLNRLIERHRNLNICQKQSAILLSVVTCDVHAHFSLARSILVISSTILNFFYTVSNLSIRLIFLLNYIPRIYPIMYLKQVSIRKFCWVSEPEVHVLFTGSALLFFLRNTTSPATDHNKLSLAQMYYINSIHQSFAWHCWIMVLMTTIVRVKDALPLAASVQEDEQVLF